MSAYDDLAWKVLDEKDSSNFKKCSVEEIERKLSELLQIDGHETSLPNAIILDYYVASVWFCTENNFDSKELSCFITLQQILLDSCKCGMSLDEVIKSFKTYIQCIEKSSLADSGSLTCSSSGFRKHIVKKIIDYVTISFFQHYCLYQNVFQKKQEAVVEETKLFLNIAPEAATPFPPPLEEGICEDWYRKFLLPSDEIEGKGDTEDHVKEVDSHGEINESLKTADCESHINEATANQILSSLSPDEIKTIVIESMGQTMTTLKDELLSKIQEKESEMLRTLSKINIS